MKVLKRFLSRGSSESDISPSLPTSIATSRRSVPPSTRAKTASSVRLAPAPVTAESKRKQDKRQQKIQQFLNNNGVARRTWEGKPSGSAPFTSAPTIATESSSSSSINSMTEEDAAMDASAPALLEDQRVNHLTLDNSSSNEHHRSSLLSSSPDHKKKSRRRRRKVISWDASVEVDQSKRELTRQFRSALPEWKQRQMAHRVHHCNVRKAELAKFQQKSGEAEEQPVPEPEPDQPQEIAVTPAAEGWFERCDRDISAEYLQNIDLVFAKKSSKISSGKSVDFFATPGKVRTGGNRSVASF